MSVGIKDVAVAAGVSPATVSRVLANRHVKPDLRERVETAIRLTGYRPNLSARRLRSQHSNTIGLIVPDIRNPFFTALSRAVEDAAYKANMRVVLCNTDENPSREMMYLRLMQEERVTGVIYAPTRETAAQLDRLAFDFPVVLVDRHGPAGKHDSVVLDNRQASAALVEHLRGRGFTHIGGLFGNTSSTARDRLGGYTEAMSAHGLAPRADFVAPNPDAAAVAARDILSRKDRPEALIASNGLILLGVVQAMRELGLEAPKDIAIAGFDNEIWTALMGPGFTVIEQPVADIGHSAMRLLFERIETPDMAPRVIMLSGKLIERNSTRKPC
ncbi:Transcriptional regulator, LacI family [uncultured Pleomorphomonas sp.]|uniref:Transcriptional regulator, LacI family n=1 Tax=uncultured Pleomorphomonas sp. TaxID=442121 RepID=A0A212LHY3_9HYPH|nr:LacI family DNA-binding transcriptional regulator [uncultured Pleomorphomonas sp.]SCM77118.1 Transcriptional regulator, LacI family [uncultured Pleomorphomonas sp.]